MSTCQSCIGLDCTSIFDDDNIYSLDRTIFPFLIHCPAGYDCSQTRRIEFVCCGETIVAEFPPGTTTAGRQEILQRAVNECEMARAFCQETVITEGDDPNEPPPPPFNELFYSRARVSTVSCDNGGVFHFQVQSGSFVASTQAAADLLAAQFVASHQLTSQFCLRVPSMCFCSGEASSFTMAIQGGTGPFSFGVIDGVIPVGTTMSIAGRYITISGTPLTPGIYSFTLNISDGNGHYLLQTVSLSVLLIGYGATVLSDFTVPNVSSSVSVEFSSDGFAVGDIIRFALVVSGVTTIEYGSFTVAALDSPGPGFTSITNVTAVPGDTIPAGATGYWELGDPPILVVGDPYSLQLPAVGGSGDYSWSASGALPDGLTMTDAGLISGTPTSTDEVIVTFTVTDNEC